MQISIYYKKEDEYLLDKVDQKASLERRSRSAVVFSILESYFETDRKLGQILLDMDLVSPDKLEACLRTQREETTQELLGQLLVRRGHLREVDLDRALAVQQESV